MNVAESRQCLDALCALLRGERPAWPLGRTEAEADGFLRLARAHGVTPLVDAALTAQGATHQWPEAFSRECHTDAVAFAMRELAHRAELARVLAAMVQSGIEPLILKGTALAYTHYRAPALRPRGDTDLLVSDGAAATLRSLLAGMGYVREPASNGEVVSCQSTWSRTDDLGVVHHFDVHWRASNSRVLAREIHYEPLAGRAQAIPALGPHARGLAAADALLYACAHRAGHVNTTYYSGDDILVGGDRLVWFYDMHLLVQALSRSELDEFVESASRARLRAICLDALERTRECLGTPIPAAILDELRRPGPVEPSARYLQGRRLNQMVGDFLALEDWPLRLRWLRELGFPAADYMRRKYPDATLQWLPALYLRRAGEGLRKMLSRRGAGHPRF